MLAIARIGRWIMRRAGGGSRNSWQFLESFAVWWGYCSIFALQGMITNPRRKSIVIVLLAGGLFGQTRGAVKVTLVDGTSGKALGRTEVLLVNRVQCVRAPCPLMTVREMRTDAAGVVRIPDLDSKKATHLKMEGYHLAAVPSEDRVVRMKAEKSEK